MAACVPGPAESLVKTKPPASVPVAVRLKVPDASLINVAKPSAVVALSTEAEVSVIELPKLSVKVTSVDGSIAATKVSSMLASVNVSVTAVVAPAAKLKSSIVTVIISASSAPTAMFIFL